MLDGACGTSLIARGLNVEAEPKALWNLTHPDDVRAMHQSFVEVGAGAVQTNTFVANRLSFEALQSLVGFPDYDAALGRYDAD